MSNNARKSLIYTTISKLVIYHPFNVLFLTSTFHCLFAFKVKHINISVFLKYLVHFSPFMNCFAHAECFINHILSVHSNYAGSHIFQMTFACFFIKANLVQTQALFHQSVFKMLNTNSLADKV